MSDKYIEVGQIVAEQGIKGEIRIHPWCDSPEFLLEFDELYYEDESIIKIEKSRVQKNVVIAKVKGIDTIEQAQKLRNKVLYINRDDIELDDNTYFVQDLIGLEVVDNDDKTIIYGEIVEVSSTGANDVYHIKNGDKMYYIPAIPLVVIKTDLDNRVMEIKPLKGLFDDED